MRIVKVEIWIMLWIRRVEEGVNYKKDVVEGLKIGLV